MKNLITRAARVAVVFILVSCSGTFDVVPTPNVPTDTPNCNSACARLNELKCEEGKPLEDGTTCETFCINTQNSGHALNPSCVMKITACDQINTCG